MDTIHRERVAQVRDASRRAVRGTEGRRAGSCARAGSSLSGSPRDELSRSMLATARRASAGILVTEITKVLRVVRREGERTAVSEELQTKYKTLAADRVRTQVL